jgi:iron(III) transport system ATP-binding protein
VRPEQVLLDDNGSGVVGTVTATVFYGHDALVRLSVPAADGQVSVSARCQGLPSGVDVGDSVGLRVVGPVTFFPA